MKRRNFLAASAGVAGFLTPKLLLAAQPCPPPTASATRGSTKNTQTTSCVLGNAEKDWMLRSGQDSANPQPGVVWFHDFRSDAEVGAFRWSPGYGNDPNATGANGETPFPGNTRRITSDGITGTGSGVLEIFAHTNSQSTGETAEFWRPFSPLKAPGNGKPKDDPGANGTIAAQTWSVSPGSGTTAGWSKGYYGHQSYWAGDPGTFDGSEWWLQCRLKVPSARYASNNTVGGKLFYFTRTDRSLTDQEIVTESRELDTGKPYFSLYVNSAQSQGQPLEAFSPGVNSHGNQPGIQGGTTGDGVCRFDNNGSRAANCFQYPLDQWFTIMYHFVPGREGVAESQLEVWIQLAPGGAVRRIWEQTFPMQYDKHSGHNALIFSGYQNRFQGNSIGTAFSQRMTQVIFSKQTIPFPQA